MRGDVSFGNQKLAADEFQSTPLCEGRQKSAASDCLSIRFNPRPSVRGDITRLRRWNPSSSFNPRPSVRGDIPVDEAVYAALPFQSTPLCEGRRARLEYGGRGGEVSIHAPL